MEELYLDWAIFNNQRIRKGDFLICQKRFRGIDDSRLYFFKIIDVTTMFHIFNELVDNIIIVEKYNFFVDEYAIIEIGTKIIFDECEI